MAYTYKRKVGCRKYRNYTDKTLAEAIAKIKNQKMGIREVSRKFGISRSTLGRKVNNIQMKNYGRPNVLNSDELKHLRGGVKVFAEWGFLLTRFEISLIVKSYLQLDEKGITETRFSRNLPSSAWVKHFIETDPSLKEKICANIKRSRASVSAEMINSILMTLKEI